MVSFRERVRVLNDRLLLIVSGIQGNITSRRAGRLKHMGTPADEMRSVHLSVIMVIVCDEGRSGTQKIFNFSIIHVLLGTESRVIDNNVEK